MIAVTAPWAGAQDNELEEVMVYGTLSRFSALKADTPIMEMARSVSIVSEQKIMDIGALALDDTFTYSAGVTGKLYGYATRGDWVKVRGLNVPMYQDSLQSLFGNYNNTRPNIYTLEQVEILKGPASVLYGQGSPGGLINVISKRPREESAHEVVVELGNFDHKQLAFDSTGSVGDSSEWFYRVVGVYKDSDTQVDYVGMKNTVLAPSLSWRPGMETDVTLLLNYSKTDSDTAAQFLPLAGTLYAAPNGRYIDASTYLGEPGFNKYEAKTTSVTLLASHQFNDVWGMEFTSRYTDAKADYQQTWASFIGGDRYIYNADGTLYKDGLIPRTFYRNDAFSEQAAVDVRLRGRFDTGLLAHSLLMGVQYQDVTTGRAGYYLYALGYDFVTRGPDATYGDRYWINPFNPVYGNVPPSESLNALYAARPDSNTKDMGVYISDQITLGNWHVTLGLRWDNTESKTAGASQKDKEVSASAGLLYQFDNGIAPYVSYAESFDPVIGDNGAGRPLKPEQGEQWEAGVKYQPDALPLLVTLAWFDIEQSNLADPLSKPGTYNQQSGVTEIKGVELEAQAQLDDVRFEFNYNRLNTETPDGWRLSSIPKQQASTFISWRPQQFWQGFKAGAGVRYVGGSWGGTNKVYTPSYTLADLMLGWEFARWDIALNLRNVADKSYNATCLGRGDCFPGDERTAVARITYQF